MLDDEREDDPALDPAEEDVSPFDTPTLDDVTGDDKSPFPWTMADSEEFDS